MQLVPDNCGGKLMADYGQSKFSKEQFDEIFEAALKDLVEHEDVVESIDIK